MKLFLGLAAALMIASAAHGQTNQVQSDQYLCNHGDATDPQSIAACTRLRNGEGAPGATVTPPAVMPTYSQPSSSSSGFAGAEPANKIAAAPAAAPQPTDAGEAPVTDNGDSAAAAEDQDNASVDLSGHGGLLAGLGALAIIFIAVGCFTGLALYFVPTIIALARHKRNALAIFALNLFFGWSVIGWVAALVWSLTSESLV